MATEVDNDCRESFEDLRSALDASGVVGTWDWDIVRRTARYDRGAANLLALDPDLAGQPLQGEAGMVGIHPDDREWLVQALWRALANGRLFLAEYRVVTADRGIRWILSRGRIYQDDVGRPVRSKGIIIDITETREEGNGFFTETDAQGRHALDRAAASLLDARKAIDELGDDADNHLRVILDLALFEVGTHLARRARH
ncbi:MULTISPECIES: PAS domain-containing protein [unclassified Methylobacterium]|uniref:PAS domain-containing protein n=1 Tax=Methylobacterium TaxID=407 RepID=UPI001FBAA06A|nr:PAS domain-containing protein [Methylobacterium sp. J-067]MCJ2024612.1 PAS domain-containing protein [Methylobacterium sp. J-067]